MAAKIIPLGGKHRSAQSLLAELQANPSITGVAVVTFQGDHDVGYAYYDCSPELLTLAGAILTQRGLADSED